VVPKHQDRAPGFSRAERRCGPVEDQLRGLFASAEQLAPDPGAAGFRHHAALSRRPGGHLGALAGEAEMSARRRCDGAGHSGCPCRSRRPSRSQAQMVGFGHGEEHSRAGCCAGRGSPRRLRLLCPNRIAAALSGRPPEIEPAQKARPVSGEYNHPGPRDPRLPLISHWVRRAPSIGPEIVFNASGRLRVSVARGVGRPPYMTSSVPILRRRGGFHRCASWGLGLFFIAVKSRMA
jgi:hypothetical protein